VIEKKMVVYVNSGRGESAVVYMFQDGAVYFSALNSDGTSSINAAEKIIRLIAVRQEMSSHHAVKFYDVQTHRGYLHMAAGEFLITRIQCRKGTDISVEKWHEISPDSDEIPRDILKEFESYIN
jgi:hypothetical protein